MYSTALLHYRSTRHRPGHIRCLPIYTLLHTTTPGVIPTTLFYTLNKLYPSEINVWYYITRSPSYYISEFNLITILL